MPGQLFTYTVSGSVSNGALTLLSASNESKFFEINSLSITGSGVDVCALRSNLNGDVQNLFSVTGTYGSGSQDALFYTNRGALLEVIVSGSETFQVTASYATSGMAASFFRIWSGSVEVGTGSGGAPMASLETVSMQAPGSSWLVSPRAARDATFGSTIGGHFIGISGSSGLGDHYFYFTQADEAGTQRGIDPGSEVASLSGYSGHAVSLANGLLSGSDVAAALSGALATVYTGSNATIGISGDVVTLEEEIDSSNVFTGNAWDERGPTGIWGVHLETALSNDFDQNDTTMGHMLTPNVSGTIYLRGMGVFLGSTFDGSDLIRLCVYQSGTSDTDPTGATLLYDFGQIPSGSSADSWVYLFATSSVELVSGVNTWPTAIAIGNGNTSIQYENSTSDIGDFTFDSNIFNANSSLGNSPGSDAPSTVPAGTTETAFGYVPGLRLIYEVAPLARNGEWKRVYGTHVADPLALTNTSEFSGTVMLGGNLPTQASGTLIDYVEVATTQSADFRVSFLQGGAVEDPDGATVLWDAGQLAGGPSSEWTRLTATGSHPIDTNSPIWVWIKGVGTNGRVRFDLGLDPGQASPDDNPFDWPANLGVGTRGEYETQGNPNHIEDPTVPFETTFVEDASDFFPGNIPGFRFRQRIEGFSLSGTI